MGRDGGRTALDRAGPRPGTWCTSEGSSRDPSGGSLELVSAGVLVVCCLAGSSVLVSARAQVRTSRPQVAPSFSRVVRRGRLRRGG